ncbi:MAG: hypothetical protein AAB393_17305, partial [Bacteroidota bacterium]
MRFVSNTLSDPLVRLRARSVSMGRVSIYPESLYFSLPWTSDTVRTNLRITNGAVDTLRYRIVKEPGPSLSEAVKRSETQQESHTLGKGALDNRAGENAPLGRGGPDAFGYQWIDSDEPGGPTFNWLDIRSVGTPITGWSPNADDGYANIPLPWGFRFYGVDHNSVNVCTNGFISFSSTSNSYANNAIPSIVEPNGAVYAFWDDLNLTSTGSVHYYHDVPSQRLIIQYTDVPYFTGTGRCTFQVVLIRNGDIITQYNSLTGLLTSSTIGLENQTGTIGLQVVFNAPYLHNDMAIRFTADPVPWLSTD